MTQSKNLTSDLQLNKNKVLYPVLTYSRNLGDFSPDLAELYDHGLKAIRLIYKGKSEEEFNLRILEIQKYLDENKIDIDIFIDLPGNKPTVANLDKGLDVKAGMEYHLADQESEFSPTVIPTVNFFNHTNFPNLVNGDIISVADDELNLLVKDIQETRVVCEAMNAFYLTSNRSMSVKTNPFVFEANSERDIQFVQNFKYPQTNIKLFVSFAKKAHDLDRLKSLQPKLDIIPKIENILDDTDLIEILDRCETVLLGRGDLSTSYEPNEIFTFQKRLIDLCKKHNKRLIIGTGLLTGIGEKQTPAISEIMDYSYLRSMGIEAFLITGSNASKQPLKTIKFMNEFEL